jgi:hypothetical protein
MHSVQIFSLSIQMISTYLLLVWLTVSKLRMLFHSSCCILDLAMSFISIRWCTSCDLRSTREVECGPKYLTGANIRYSIMCNSASEQYYVQCKRIDLDIYMKNV